MLAGKQENRRMYMHTNKWLFFLLLIISGSAQSFQASIEIVERFDDTRLIAFVKQSDLDNYPAWNPASEAPPLSIKQAIQAIHNLDIKNNSNPADDMVKEIELREIPQYKSHWHYLIKVRGTQSHRYQVYVVLMNGKVIPAMIEPESYK